MVWEAWIPHMSLFWRSWQIVTTLIVVVLGVLCVLAALQFNRIESDLIRGRLAVLAESAHAPFQSAARLGLPLANVRNATAIIERSRITDPQIAAIHVFDPVGTIVHSSESDTPTSVRSEVLFALSAASGPTWNAEASDFMFTGKQITDVAGKAVGGIVVVYPRIDLLTSIQAMVTKLLLYSIMILLIMSPIAAIVLRVGLRRPIGMFSTLLVVLDGFERDAWRRQAGSSHDLDHVEKGLGFDAAELTRLTNAAEANYTAGGKELSAIEQGEER